MTVTGDRARQALLRRGFALEYATLAWNVAGIVVLAIAAVAARSVALAGSAPVLAVLAHCPKDFGPWQAPSGGARLGR